MFRIDILQNQWLMLELIGGAALVLLVTMWYVAYWREEKGGEGQGSVPWVLITIFVGVALFAAGYVAARAWYPPNW